ncbi:hypothetical protein F4780DRAFT_730342 [Xylariomycetidae sp. FL0641]|nr:hypothetical protein F4780DRAFT_730342 [Xylariomycetidae sp. FL0641]
MSRKSVLSALGASNGTLEAATRRIAASGQHRSFTSTTPRNAHHIAHFTPASTPELDALLKTIREKIIMPAYLPANQRKKIYSPKFEKKLRADPITIEIDGEVFRFRYQPRFGKETPALRKTFASAIEKFETDADFANLRPLMEGLHASEADLEASFYTKVLRLAGERGHIFAVIECARSVRRTGFALDSSEKACEALHFLQLKAADHGWDQHRTRQALRWAEMVLTLLEDEAHQPKAPCPRGMMLPLDRDPLVLAAPLHLAAMLASRHAPADAAPEAAEARLKVFQHARDVVRLWPPGRRAVGIQPPELYEKHHPLGWLREPNKFLAIASPLLHGLREAQKHVQPPLADELKARYDILAEEIQDSRKALEKPGRGEAVYRKFFDA